MSDFLTSIVFAAALLLSPVVSAQDDQRLVAGDSQFRFSSWDGPAFDAHVFVPDSVSAETTIVMVMHGFSRDIDRYFNDWRTQGEKHEFIVVVPHLDKETFPGSNEYNLGHVNDKESGERRPESLWTYSAIEPLFDEVVLRLGGRQTEYTLFGHSAGSQFVHRFLFFKPHARVTRYIAANAGWYMMPDLSIGFPYGFKNSGLDERAFKTAFEKDVIVMLGTEDTDPNDPDLRQTEEALNQGLHRLQRGKNFIRFSSAQAEKNGSNLRWQLRLVEGAGHNNAAMAGAAAVLVD